MQLVAVLALRYFLFISLLFFLIQIRIRIREILSSALHFVVSGIFFSHNDIMNDSDNMSLFFFLKFL